MVSLQFPGRRMYKHTMTGKLHVQPVARLVCDDGIVHGLQILWYSDCASCCRFCNN